MTLGQSKKFRARILHAAALILLLALSLPSSIVPAASANARTGPILSALSWLINHQQADGSYGSLTELQTAPAANALWIRYRDSQNVVLAYSWLKNAMNNSTTWFWGSFGEADVPGEVLYGFDASQHLKMLNVSAVATRLLSFQDSSGGFRGYAPAGRAVTSSVDTAMALLGLINAKAIPSTNLQNAINYLYSLQNSDGSFNLTRPVRSDPLYSLGPEPISITALVVMVLKDASYTLSDSRVSSALNYISKASSQNFNGHVYAAALSALAFTLYGKANEASSTVSFVISQQNSDGGFRDTVRFSTSSNALDTGWAAIALELAGLLGDVNLDGIVNILDMATIAYAYQATPGSLTWTPRADLDGNGVINILDAATGAFNYDKTADSL